ncbi:MAG: hypothetical protein RR054_04030 [Clostridia bacterium]
MKKIDTKTITITAILIALSIIWVRFMITIPFGIWSFTPFSHIFIFLGMLINPIAGILTAVGAFLGFVLKGVDIVVLMRAGSHIIFVVVGLLLLRVLHIKKFSHFMIFLLVTGLVHALGETACVYIALFNGIKVNNSTTIYIWGATFGATFLHNALDFVAAYFLGKLLVKAKIVVMKPLMTT